MVENAHSPSEKPEDLPFDISQLHKVFSFLVVHVSPVPCACVPCGCFFVHVHSPTIAKIIAVLLLWKVIIERILGSSFIVTVILKKEKESVVLQTVS